jgi:hypothetical protein
MKKILFLAVFLLTFNISNAQTKAIKANPIGLAFGIANVGFEFATAESQSATIAGVYFDVLDIKGAGLGAEYRFYFDGEAIEGWHAGPSIGFLSLSDDYDVSASVFTIGGEIGHQWILGSNFALDVFAGYGYILGGDDLNGLESSSTSFGVSIGYAW